MVGLCTDREAGRLIPPGPLPISYTARGNSSSSRGVQITAEEVLGLESEPICRPLEEDREASGGTLI